MLNLDPAKLLVIFAVALIVLGPERLPKVARQLAALWRELSKIRDQVSEEVRQAMPDLDLPSIPRIPSPSRAVSGFLTDLTRPRTDFSGSRASAPEDATRSGKTAPPGDATATPARRMPPALVVHPSLGEVAFLPDDPEMN